jgi:hypothetical protein
MRGLILAAATCAAVVFVGCKGEVPRGRVYGKITVQGKAVPGATVVFIASDNRTHPIDLKPDGSYEVTGVALGPVKVSVQPAAFRAAVKGEFDPPPPTSAAKGVKDEKAGKTSLDDAPKAEKTGSKVPAQYADAEKSGLTFELKSADQEWSVDLK